MIRITLLFFIILGTMAQAEQLRVVADSFDADQQKGISVFTGHVKIKKSSDELNASKVTIYTNADRKPQKMIAEGDVSFYVKTATNDTYRGVAEKAIFHPIKKVYEFYTNVHLEQINQNKAINGDEVIIDTVKGTAYAKGAERKPVIMIFDITENEQND